VIDCRRAGGLLTNAACSKGITTGTSVVVTVTPGFGTELCIGTSCSIGVESLTVTLSNAVLAYNVAFNLLNPHIVTITPTGTGSGTITSNPVGMQCPPTCAVAYADTLSVNFTATPASGSTWTKWTGACSSALSVCSLVVNSNKFTSVYFDLLPQPSPSPTATTLPTAPPATPSPTPGHSATPSSATPSSPTASQGPTTSQAPTAAPNPSEGPIATSAGPSSSPDPSGSPTAGASIAPTAAPGESQVPIPAGSSGGDSTLLALAILVGALVLAGGMVFLGLQLRRRSPG
jgi:hypothetical protein